MVTLAVYDQSGSLTGESYDVDPAEFAAEVNNRLLHEAVVMYASNRRLGTSKTKSRAEVAGSSKKLFKQKGTGNARMGNKRTPIRRGGGHCFAKRPRDWGYRLPRTALRRATAMAIASKLRDGEVMVLKDLVVSQPKTKPIGQMLGKIGVAGKTCVIGVAQGDAVLWKSCRNIPGVSLVPVMELNAATVLRKKYFVVTAGALDRLREKFSSGVRAS
jgi:large subunit ribosomal protein L4